MLSSLYQYACIAYIGGGFGKGIHNVLEAATFGVPIIFGPNYKKFNEAKQLIENGAAKSILNQTELLAQFEFLLENEVERKQKGEMAKNYVLSNVGSTQIILNYLLKNKLLFEHN